MLHRRDRVAFDEPVDAPPARWIGSLVLLNLGLMAGWFGPIQVLLAQQADRVASAEPAAAGVADADGGAGDRARGPNRTQRRPGGTEGPPGGRGRSGRPGG